MAWRNHDQMHSIGIAAHLAAGIFAGTVIDGGVLVTDPVQEVIDVIAVGVDPGLVQSRAGW